jgi:membrane-bound lytic murein transglycosylase B
MIARFYTASDPRLRTKRKSPIKIIGVLVIACLTAATAICKEPDAAFQKLMQRLIRDGLDSTRIQMYFEDERLEFLPDLIRLNLVQRETPDIYSKFLTRNEIQDGYYFLQMHRDEIVRSSKNSTIPPEYFVAILKIETNLGRNSGKYPILSSFVTIALLADSLHWVERYDTSAGRDLERLQRRAVRRAEWAYKEMKDFLTVCERAEWDPFSVRGSWAGAFGWAQFLPSSYLRFAADGDGDGKIDPYSLIDAVAGIQQYLYAAGWGRSDSSKRKALLQYNPSSAYADCVLEYARRLQALQKAQAKPETIE